MFMFDNLEMLECHVAMVSALLLDAGLFLSPQDRALLFEEFGARHFSVRMNFVTALQTLYAAGLLTGGFGFGNFKLLLLHIEYAEELASALSTLHQSGLLIGEETERNREWLGQHAKYASFLACGLSVLYTAGLFNGTETEKEREMLVGQLESFEYPNRRDIHDGSIRVMRRPDGIEAPKFYRIKYARLFDGVRLDMILNKPLILFGAEKLSSEESRVERVIALICIITYLYQAGLLTGDQAEKNRELLVEQIGYVHRLDEALWTAHKERLLIGEDAQENWECLVQGPEYASGVVVALFRLNQHGLLKGKQAKKNRRILAQHGQSAEEFTTALIRLRKSKFVSRSNEKDDWALLAQHVEHAQMLAGALIKLHQVGLMRGAVAKRNRELLAQHAEYADTLAESLFLLKQAGLLMGVEAQGNWELLVRFFVPEQTTNFVIGFLHYLRHGITDHIQWPQLLQNAPASVNIQQLREVARNPNGGYRVARAMLFWMLGSSDLLSQADVVTVERFRRLSSAFEVPVLTLLSSHAILFHRIDYEKEDSLPEDCKRLIRANSKI